MQSIDGWVERRRAGDLEVQHICPSGWDYGTHLAAEQVRARVQEVACILVDMEAEQVRA